jgi:hypothetical protein
MATTSRNFDLRDRHFDPATGEYDASHVPAGRRVPRWFWVVFVALLLVQDVLIEVALRQTHADDGLLDRFPWLPIPIWMAIGLAYWKWWR